MSIQVKVALRKERRPELYCPWPKCLWETGDGSRCPRHGGPSPALRNRFKKGAP